MQRNNTSKKILPKPRQRHYILGHEAFRQMCEHDPHQFFEVMVSAAQKVFIAELVNQVQKSCSEDTTELDAESIVVSTSRIDNRPFMLIEMPAAKGCVECVYVGIVSMMDINNPQETPHPEICYFTLELAVEERNAVANEADSQPSTEKECRLFCEWRGDTHYNLAQLDKDCSASDFSLMIKQRMQDRKA